MQKEEIAKLDHRGIVVFFSAMDPTNIPVLKDYLK
jgi:hypothetical protein